MTLKIVVFITRLLFIRLEKWLCVQCVQCVRVSPFECPCVRTFVFVDSVLFEKSG